MNIFCVLAPRTNSRFRSRMRSYGFGFVDYVSEEDAETAIQKLNGMQLQNKRIKVSDNGV